MEQNIDLLTESGLKDKFTLKKVYKKEFGSKKVILKLEITAIHSNHINEKRIYMETDGAGVIAIKPEDENDVKTILDPSTCQDFCAVGEIINFLKLKKKSTDGDIIIDGFSNAYIAIEMDNGLVIKVDEKGKSKTLLNGVVVGSNLIKASKNGTEVYAFCKKSKMFFCISQLDENEETIRKLHIDIPKDDQVIQVCPGEFQIILLITHKGYCLAIDTQEQEIKVVHSQKINLGGMDVSSAIINYTNDYLILTCYKVEKTGIGFIFKPKCLTKLMAFEIQESDLKKIATFDLPNCKGIEIFDI